MSLNNSTHNTKVAVESILSQVYTMVPAIVIRYDRVNQTIDAELAVKQPYKNGSEEQPTKVYSIPVVFPQGDDWVIASTLKAGDAVLVHFSMYNMENWLAGNKSKVYDAGGTLMHDLNSGFATPGAFSYDSPTRDNRFRDKFHIVKAHNYLTMDKDDGINLHSDKNHTITTPNATIEISSTGDMTFTNGGGSLTLSNSGNATLVNSGTTLVESSQVILDTPQTQLTGNLSVAGSISVSGTGGGSASTIFGGMNIIGGDVTADGISLKTHIHTVLGAGSSAGDNVSAPI